MREEHKIRISGLGSPLGLFRSGQTFVAESLIIVTQHLNGEKSVNFLTSIETIRILILDNDNLMHSFLMYLFYTSTCFEQQVLTIRSSKLY
jgi:hypothetical protein